MHIIFLSFGIIIIFFIGGVVTICVFNYAMERVLTNKLLNNFWASLLPFEFAWIMRSRKVVYPFLTLCMYVMSGVRVDNNRRRLQHYSIIQWLQVPISTEQAQKNFQSTTGRELPCSFRGCTHWGPWLLQSSEIIRCK